MAVSIVVSGLIFIFGFLSSKVFEKIKIPSVTAYLIAGVIIGPYMLNLVPDNLIHSTDLIANVILSMVAFSLGQTFSRKHLKRIGHNVMFISWGEVLGAFLLVIIVLNLAGVPLYQALLYGGIAPATAPAATIMVIREYKAKGIFTDTLLGVVAIDDAWGIIVFALAMSVAKVIAVPGITGSLVVKQFLLASLHVILALLLGIMLGIIFSLFSKFVKSDTNVLIVTLGFILLASGISLYFNLSDLLTNMAMGAAFVNLKKEDSSRYFESLKRIDWPFYLYFFVLTGAGLEIPLLKEIGFIGFLYLISRPLGEYIGAFIGSVLGKAEKKVRNLIGLGLVPQAGVALGLAILVKNEFKSSIGPAFLTTIVATTIIYEIVGPFFTKLAIQKAGEIPG